LLLVRFSSPNLFPLFLVLGVLAFNKSRQQFNELLSGSSLTNHRYIRLMCLVGISSLLTLVLGTYALINNCTTQTIEPWLGWADTHYDFSRVDQIPALIWRNSAQASIEISRWMGVIAAFTFFIFFGFAEEARKNYQSVFQSVTKRVGVSSFRSFSIGTSGSSFFNSSGYVRTLTCWRFSHLIIPSQIKVWLCFFEQ
jgi:pheromone a factor receptor